MTTTIRVPDQAPGQAARSRAEFGARFRNSFRRPGVSRPKTNAIARLEAIAWQAYSDGRKAPITRKAGPGFADPDYELSVEWLDTSERLKRAQKVWADRRRRRARS